MFLTLIVWLSSHLSDVSSWLTEKLGMYFYISSTASTDLVNTKVVSLLQDLKNVKIEASYLSKQEAVSSLQKKLPDIVKSFKDYNIDSNLPATLYITVRSEKARKSLETILPRYADIIENVKDVAPGSSIKTQEQRVMRALDFAYFLRWASIVLIIVFSLVMIAVVLLLLFFKLKQFEDVVTLKKMLGASDAQMRNPFLIFIWSVIGSGYILSLIFTILIGIGSIGSDESLIYFSQLLGVESMQTGIRWLLLGGYLSVLLLVFVVAAIVWFLSSLMIEHNIKKIN